MFFLSSSFQFPLFFLWKMRDVEMCTDEAGVLFALCCWLLGLVDLFLLAKGTRQTLRFTSDS
jgi:hypothetical protein